MKRLLLLLLLAAPVHADMRHSIKSSATIQLDAAYSSANRVGTTLTVSGSNVTPSTTVSGTTTANAIGSLTLSSLTAGVPAVADRTAWTPGHGQRNHRPRPSEAPAESSGA